MVQTDDRKPRLTIGRLLLLAVFLGLAIAAVIPVYRRISYISALRRTMADIRVWEKAIAAYKAAHGTLPPNPHGEITFGKRIIKEARPFLERIRTADWWGNHYWIWIGPSFDEYGVRSKSPEDVLIVSRGKEGLPETWRYDPADPEAGFFDLDRAEDFEKDLVVWNGRPVRWPKGWR